MSNYLRNNDDATRETTSPFRRRRLWLATGVVGLTGAVSLAGVAYATTGMTGAHRLTDLKWSTAQQVTSDDSKGGEQNARDQVAPDGKGGEETGAVEVPCDEKELVKAVVLANQGEGGTLRLAKDCTYTLNKFDKKSGTALPTIKKDITIEGEGSTIERDSKDAFRLFRVAKDGDLHLKDLTVKNGNAADGHDKHKPKPPGAKAAPPPNHPHDKHEGDGGGLLVERGGKATVHGSAFTRNTAADDGGAIANFGKVEVEASTIDNNHAKENGGGIFNAGLLKVGGATGGKGGESLISNNTAGENGGGIANGEEKHKHKHKPKDSKGDLVDRGRHGDHHGKAGVVKVENTVIENNVAYENGGGISSNGGHVHVSSAFVKNNTACENGGGIYANDAVLKVDQVLVEKNHAGKDGGGIYNTDGKHKKPDATGRGGEDHYKDKGKGGEATITASEILGNTAGRFGGGIFNGKPKDWDKKENDVQSRPDGHKSRATVTLTDTKIKENIAANGGGIFNNKGKVTLTNTEVTENKATKKHKKDEVAGGIVNIPGKVVLDKNSIVLNNDPKNCAGPVPGCFN